MKGASSNRTHRYLLGVATGYCATVLSIGVAFWLTPFKLRILGREQYGLVALATSVISWLSFLDFGISGALRVHLAQLTGQYDRARIIRYCNTAFFAELIVVLATLCAGWALAATFSAFFKVPPSLTRDAAILLAVMVMSASVTIGSKTFSSILVAHQQLHIDNLIHMVNIVVSTAVTVVLLLRGWGVVSVALAGLGAALITSASAAMRAYRMIPGFRLHPRLGSWDTVRALMGTAMWFTIGSVATILLYSMDRVLVAKFVSLSAVATLTLTKRLYDLLGTFLNPLWDAARPALGQLLGAGRRERARDVYFELSAVSMSLAAAAALTLWAGNRAFLCAWVGRENYGGAFVDAAFALNFFLQAWILGHRATLSSALSVRPPAVGRLVEGVVNVGLALLLVSHLGLAGVVLASPIAALATSSWYLPFHTARSLREPFRAFIVHPYRIRTAAFAGLVLPLAWAARSAAGAHGYFAAFCAAAVTAAWSLVALWLVALSPEVRTTVLLRLARTQPFGYLARTARLQA